MCLRVQAMSDIVIDNSSSVSEEDIVLTENLFKKLEQYINNRALDSVSLLSLVVAYAILIFIGTLGNGLVCVVVARKPKMRTSRNLFIINLAISDLLLCFFTIPFSLVEISVKFWPFGLTMCKLVLALEATSIFVSTISITAIALDRYQVILHSAGERKTWSSVLKLLLIWFIAVMLALPLFLFRTIETYHLNVTQLPSVDFCIEKWPIQHGRGYYSVFSMLVQYVMPIIIVSVVYTRVCMKLQTRALRRTSTTQLPKLKNRLKKRTRKTNALLISIALIFCISWLPLNLINIVADFCFPFKSDETFRIVFAICHMAGMSSACSNPLLYGWLNNNFRNEFRELFDVLRSYLGKCYICGNRTRNQRKRLDNNLLMLRNGHRRASHIYCGPNHTLGDEDNCHVMPNGKTGDTLVAATTLNDIPLAVSLAVSCEHIVNFEESKNQTFFT